MTLFSVEQVAERLGLQARTVRGYIRDGRLRATKIGKQYRVAAEDLDAFTGRPEPSPPRVEASAVVECDGLTAAGADRLGTLLVAGAQMARGLRVQTVYDDARGRLKVIALGAPGAVAVVLRTIDEVLEDGMIHG